MAGPTSTSETRAARATEWAAALRDWQEAHREEMVRHLQGLVRLESPSHEAAAVGRVLDALAGDLAEVGLTPRRYGAGASAGVLLARPARSRRTRGLQLLLGHADTVWPVGTLRRMPCVLDGEHLKGPGVYDMKAGLTLLVFALRALRGLDLEPEVAPVVLVNADEEVGSPGSTRLIQRLGRIADRALVLEPSLGREGRIKTRRKGVGRFTITVQGRAAHAGLDPESGASAILELSHVVQALFALNDPARGVTVNVGQVDGGLRPNVIAPHSRAIVDVRVPTQREARRIEEEIQRLQAVTPGTRLEVEGRIGRPPLEPSPGGRALWELARELGAHLEVELEEGTAGGGSDGNTTGPLCPTLDGLGAVGDGAHALHEFVEVPRLPERAALLSLLLLQGPLRERT